MKIIQTIPTLSVLAGGPSQSTYEVVKGIHDLETDIDLVSLAPKSQNGKTTGNGEEWIKVLPNDFQTVFGFSKNIKNYLENSNYDIYHTNGLWLYTNHVTAQIANQKNKPFVITTRGMLYPDALARSAWKKWLVRKLWFDNDILNATCIHATCQQEVECIRQFGYKGPIANVGNVVEVPEFATIATKKLQGKKIIGYLGRLHQRKNVHGILQALSICPKEIKDNIVFQIMGGGDENYEKFLHQEVSRLGLEKQVEFLGFVTGEEKYRRLRDLSALFVPSDFENFGMIIPEALISGTPVMASLNTPWQSLNENSCGWWIDRTTENISEVICKVCQLSESEILEMGKRGRKLVLENFTSEVISKKMLQLYTWIYSGGVKPDFVE